MLLLFFILACYGFTHILTRGRVLNRIRPRYYFWHCPMCVGFWVGLFFAAPIVLLGDGFGVLYYEKHRIGEIFEIFSGGCISSGVSYMLVMLFGDDGVRINAGDKED